MRKVKERRVGRVVVLTPMYPLYGSEETDELEKLLEEQNRRNVPYLVLNLRRVNLITVRGLSVIIGGYKRFRDRGSSLVLCEPAAQTVQLLRITKLLELFNVYKSEAAALAAYRPGI